MDSQARVLVVDDNQRNLMAMGAVLEPVGDEIVCVDSGAKALKELLRTDFALIVLDVQMPQMDGLETARIIRTRMKSRRVPIILYTAQESAPEIIARGYQYGVVDYLAKPVDPSVLRSKAGFFVELWRLLEHTAADASRAAEGESQAKETAELERRLLGIVSHDLRNPLAAVKITALTLMNAGARSPLEMHALQRIVRSTRKMEELTSLFLDVSRARSLGGIPLTLERADMREVCRNALDELRVANPGRAITVNFDDGDGVGFWDATRVEQVLCNLVTNALKYGSPTAPVTVHVKLHGDVVAISVHNKGAPIPAELMTVMFEPFKRGAGPGQATYPNSAGLGLYIVSEIVRAHGGTVGVTSTEQMGTLFTVILPRVTVPAAAANGVRPSAQA